jgi:uncharacterized protein with FMN-binding domain
MPKRALVGTFLTTVALALLLSFKTPDTAAPSTPAPANGAGGAIASAGASAITGTSAPLGAKGAYTGQLTGSTIQTPFGYVQVQVTLQGGMITDVQTLQLPSGGRSSEISQYAAPQLRSEVLQAQSAQVDSVSGATYTSQAYRQSLQAALDQAS